ncbi:MAG: FemAB family PEP-CTERM system-associated protein [Burkholderiaceae bacterium]|nr:FemAB family PEP-CTERM system-associated protein [Burkholderiaceae bacterium]
MADSHANLSQPVAVSSAGEADRAAWSGYVDGRADASFFHRFEWRELIARQWRHTPHYLIARRGATVTGVLPLAMVKTRLFGTALVSLPFCVYGGPLADDERTLAALDARALEIAAGERAAHIEYRAMSALHPDWPSSKLYVSFRKQISADDDENMLAIPRKQRAMVRKGIGNRLEAKLEDVDAFFPLYADNVHRHGTPGMPRSWFRALHESFGRDCEVLVVRDGQGRALSAVISFYFRDQVLPYYAGDIDAARGLAANDFKYWALMRRAAARGSRLFDFGRSKLDTGAHAFKRNWGFEPTPLAYEYRLLSRDSVPQNNPSNPKYRLAIEAWRRLPRPIVNWLGPSIVRGLG